MELSVYTAPQSNLLRSIIYSEFDPHKGPRPVFQFPLNYVSGEVCEVLSDHLIASSELCGRTVSVAAFGLRFIGHPEHIRDKIYERNQFMFNVCFVFEASTDASAYRPLVAQVAEDFRLLETQYRYLTSEGSRSKVQQIIQGIYEDIITRGELRMPPSSVEDLPLNQRSSKPLALQEVLPRGAPPEVHSYEVPVVVVSSKGRGSVDDNVLQKVLPHFDGKKSLHQVVIDSALDMNTVTESARSLLYWGVIRMIDMITYRNIYIPTMKLRELQNSRPLQTQCVSYCMANPELARPRFSKAYRVLCSLSHDKRLKQVCEENALSADDNIDVIKLLTFARVHRFVRRMHHFPIWTGHPSYQGRKEDTKHKESQPKSTPPMLMLLDGSNCYDYIAVTMGMTVDEVEEECTEGQFKEEILVIVRMSQGGSTVDNP